MSVNTFKFSQHGNDTAQVSTATAAEASGLSGVTATATEINKLAGVTAGATTASKALVVGSSSQLDVLTVTALTATTLTATNPIIGSHSIMDLSLPTITAIAGGVKIVGIAPFAGTIVKADAAVDAAFTATDIVITLKINGTGVTNGVITIPTAGSAARTTAGCTPTALNTFTAGQVLDCTITGGVGTAGGTLTVYLKRTA